MKEKIKKLKKVELHLHLDGSIPLDTIAKLTGKEIDEIKTEVVANDKCINLSKYLEKFDLPINLMQTKENLKIVAQDLVKELECDNVIYAEIRFAPMFHTKNGLNYDEIIESVLEGLKSETVKTNLILCMMRGFSLEENLKTIEVCKKYLNKGVCAIDIAGAEDKYPLNDYKKLFDVINKENIPFTIHAGENGDFNEVKNAIKFNTKRIGHGIHANDDIETINLLKENNILLEVCPTSNVQTNSVDFYHNHPIYNLYKSGVKICINTDNRTISNITLNEEYEKLYKTFGFSINDFKVMNINAIENSFLSNLEKEKLIKEKLHLN